MDEIIDVEIKQEQDPKEISPEQVWLEISPGIIKTDLDDVVKTEDQYCMNYNEDCSNNLPSENGLFLREENASLGVAEENSVNKIDIDQQAVPTHVILKYKEDYDETAFKHCVKEEQEIDKRENALNEKILVTDLKTEIDLDNIVVKSEDQFHINCDENSSDNLPSEKGLVSKDCPSVKAIQSSETLESEYASDVVENLVNKINYDQQDVSKKELFQENVELQADVIKLKQVEQVEKDNRNMSSVSKKKGLKCLYCDYDIRYTSHLKVYVSAICKRGNARVYNCQYCTFKTLQAHDLCRHIKLHEEDIYECLGCYRAFNKKAHLDSHLLTNHGNLQHLITHKIHHCKFCTYKTIYSKNLIRHRAHNHNRNGAKKFQCHQCDYFYSRKNDLRRHLLVHSNTKLHFCTACRKEFSRKLSLDSHILSKHKGNADMLKIVTNRIHQCTFCTYQTVDSNYLYTHMKRKHK